MSPVPDENDQKKTPDMEDLSIEDVNVIPIDFTDSDDSNDEDEASNDPANNGYMPLSQGPPMADSDDEATGEGCVNSTPASLSSSVESNNSVIDHAIRQVINSDTDKSIGAVASSIFQEAESNPSERTGMSDMWNEPASADPLSEEKADEVKKVMSSILLPPCNHPDWAKNIPEEEWKAKLVPHLVGKKDCTKGNSENKRLTGQDEEKR